jgi:hypothetical protein
MNVVELCARALCEARGMRWSKLTPFGLQNLRNEALAVIDTLAANVTPGMVEAAEKAMHQANSGTWIEKGFEAGTTLIDGDVDLGIGFHAMCAAAVKGEGA